MPGAVDITWRPYSMGKNARKRDAEILTRWSKLSNLFLSQLSSIPRASPPSEERLHANPESYFKHILKMEASEPTTTLPSTTNEDLTPLEQDVLDEYERLAENMKKVIINRFNL